MTLWTSDASAPILTAHLFPVLDDRLLELLRSLAPEDWERSTIVPRWNVRQVAAHLLDTALRRLAFGRDGARPADRAPQTAAEVVALVNGMNARGVEVFGRLSPAVLVSLMETTLPQLHAYLRSLDPMSEATLGVSWAGEDRSANWFDVARELTERWHHQQQIRLAVGRPGIMEPALYAPVLDCFMRGLPHAFRQVEAAEGALVSVAIAGTSGGTRWLRRGGGRWLWQGRPEGATADASVTIPEEIAWRLFTKGIDRREALARSKIDGDERLASPVFALVAIVG